MDHITDLDLERFHLGMMAEAELVILEEHLLTCPDCIDAAEQTGQHLDSIRAAISVGDFEL
jgi:hypothetical protein